MCCYILELFPTAVRGTVSGWYYGFGMLGAISSGTVESLREAGREDLAYGIAGGLTFTSVPFLRLLPQNTAIEGTKASARRSIVVSQRNGEHMKQTLGHQDRKVPRKTRNCGSVFSTLLHIV
ncbi:hypothetical protein MTO96_034221 [Rhipicephalus appendiculatus]